MININNKIFPEETIFIAIASYCDPLLIQTIQSAFDNAQFPNRIIFGIVEQNRPEACLVVSQLKMAGQIRYFSVDTTHARGVCWARALTMSLFQGEDWFLQIDSHMIFEQGWDSSFIAKAKQCATTNPNFVISSYPNSFVIENGAVVLKPITDKVIAHVVPSTSNFKDESLVLMFIGVNVDIDTPLLGFHVGGNCLFAPGNFVNCFPYDSQLYFHGEEQSLAARLFTRGWDIFHVPGLPIYHLYEDAQKPSYRPKHWDQDQNIDRIHPYTNMYWHSEKRLKDILTGQPGLGIYGLGNQRTMQEYTEFSGIDYVNKTISDKARLGYWRFDQK